MISRSRIHVCHGKRLKKEIAERGILPVVVGTIWSAVTSPIRAIEEVFGGEPGLGEYPLKMLVGCVIFFG